MCIGEKITFICTVTRAGILQWAVESIFSLGDGVQFNVFRDQSPKVLPDSYPGVTNVTLTSAVQDLPRTDLGNLSSTITVLVSNTTLGKSVYCSDGLLPQNESPFIVISSTCKLFYRSKAVNIIHCYILLCSNSIITNVECL